MLQKLKKARDLYDQYLDLNPSEQDQFDKEYCDTVVPLYRVRNDTSLGELEGGRPRPNCREV